MYHSKELIEKELLDEDKKGEFDESSIDSKWTDANKEDESAKSPLDPEQKPPLAALINADDFERSFEKYGPRKPWAYITGASNDLLTYDANKTCWHKLWFRPRIMRDVKAITTKTKMLGQEVTMPLLIAPMGIAKTAGDEGELALGAGAARGGIIHVQSTAASFSVEDILAAVPKTHPYFFQLYVDRNRKKTEELLQRLETMDQIKAIFVTVDLPVVSKREADERVLEEQKVSLYSGDGVTNKPDKKGGGLARTTGGFIEWQLTWNDLPWIKRFTSKPIVIKGIQTAADAKLALELGCAGIVVSNHGGRALDNAPATLLSLLEIRRDCPEVFTRMEVYVDGGVRRGSDILKAVMIGAQGVGVGRPFQCAVAYNTNGVEHLCDSKSPALSLSLIKKKHSLLTKCSLPRRTGNRHAALRRDGSEQGARRHAVSQHHRAGPVPPSQAADWTFWILAIEVVNKETHNHSISTAQSEFGVEHVRLFSFVCQNNTQAIRTIVYMQASCAFRLSLVLFSEVGLSSSAIEYRV